MLKHVAVAVALIFSSIAAVAQTYIVPDANCGAITMHLARGTDPTKLSEAIDVDTVNNAHLFVVRFRKLELKPTTKYRSVVFSADMPEKGIVMATADFKPVVSGNETRTDYAKAFVYCDGTTPAFDWQTTTGLACEIFPQWNGAILHLKPGDAMHFIVVQDGHNLLRDVPMELYRVGTGRIEGGKRDEVGMNFPYKGPGRYLVTATYRRHDPKQPDKWLVDTSTLTFELK